MEFNGTFDDVAELYDGIRPRYPAGAHQRAGAIDEALFAVVSVVRHVPASRDLLGGEPAQEECADADHRPQLAPPCLRISGA
jgi:hypothetical protein